MRREGASPFFPCFPPLPLCELGVTHSFFLKLEETVHVWRSKRFVPLFRLNPPPCPFSSASPFHPFVEDDGFPRLVVVSSQQPFLLHRMYAPPCWYEVPDRDGPFSLLFFHSIDSPSDLSRSVPPLPQDCIETSIRVASGWWPFWLFPPTRFVS